MSYFKPLRRKIGVATLVLACAFAAAWMRSRVTVDMISIDSGRFMFGIGSFAGRLWLYRSVRGRDYSVPFWRTCPLSRYAGFQPDENGLSKPFDPMQELDPDWRWDFSDFHVGTGVSIAPPKNLRCEQCLLLYWSVVMPLTLPSTWLLFSKPRPKKTQVNGQVAA